MANQYALQSAFNGGEWSPLLLGQVLLKKYRDACQVLENWLAKPHGPAFTRPGFKYVATLQDSTSPGRLASFVFSNIESYTMVMENELVWFISGQTPLLDGSGNLVTVATPYLVSNPDNNDLSDLPYIQFAQSFDVQYWVNPLYPVYKMERKSTTDFLFLPVTFNDGPYMNQNDDATLYVQVGAPTGGVTEGSGAAGHIVVTTMFGVQLVTAVVTNGGTGYTKGVVIAPAAGSGCTFFPHIVGGVIKSIATSNVGVGYVNGAALTFTNSAGNYTFPVGESVTLSALYRGSAQNIGTWSGAATTAETAFSSSLPRIGLQFTPAFGFEISTVQLNVVAPPASAMSVTAYIYLDAAGSPSGSALDTSDAQDIHANGVGTSAWTFSGKVSLSVTHTYWVVWVSASPQSSVTLGAVSLDANYGSGADTTTAAITNSMTDSWQSLLGVTPAGLGAIFYPGHAGALWRVMHSGQTTSKDFTAAGQASKALLLRGKFQVDMTPDTPPAGGSYWIGTIVLQSSPDQIYWQDVATFFYSTTQSFVESRSNIYYRMYCKSYSSGSGNTGQISQTEQWGTILITSYTSASSVQGTILFPVASADPTPNWAEGAWSDYRGYPATVLFHNDRLWFFKDETFYGSWVSDFENFNPDGDTDNAAITFNPTQLENPITWAESLKGIMVGSMGEEGQISGGSGSNQTPITATSVMCNIQTSHGSAQYPEPVTVGQAVLFLQVARRKLREFVYDLATDAFKAPDLTLRAEHITESGIFDMCFVQEPDSIVYSVRGDGVLLAMVYQRDEDVVSWSRLTTQGTFESCTSKTSSTGLLVGYDELWVICNRTIGGQTVRSVEVMANNDPVSSVQQQASDLCCLDCATVAAPGSVTITGLGYLNGETVTAMADGIPVGTFVVSGGQITLPFVPTINAQVGLSYVCSLQTMPFELMTRDGSTLARQKTAFQLLLRLINSSGGKYGPSFDNMQDIPYDGVVADLQMVLFTGVKALSYDDNNLDVAVCIQQTQPLPLTLAALSLCAEVGD